MRERKRNVKKIIAVLMVVTLLLVALGGSTVLAGVSTTTGTIVSIDPPASVVRGELESDSVMRLFQEQEDLELSGDVVVNIINDGTYDASSDPIGTETVPAGTWVDSYLLHMDPVGAPSNWVCIDGSVTFEEDIIGLILFNAQLEGSDGTLGYSATVYPASGTDAGRRVELPGEINPGTLNDVVTLSGSTLEVHLCVHSEWSDQIRVLTPGTGIIPVEIDIKPGSDPNSFNINGKGVVPVAILGSADFDVSDVDVTSLEFAGLAVRVKGNGSPQCSIEDVSGANMPYGEPDGYEDLVCQFVDDAEGWTPGDAVATLTGNLFDGTAFEGTDSINIVP
jgi:hypothetical protein